MGPFQSLSVGVFSLIGAAVSTRSAQSLVLQRAEERLGLLAGASKEVDVVVAARRAPEDHAVGVESRG